ncbi:MAG: TIGR02281 family clan AA aspartic protease [Alphaproteobacteria bacterium]|nr:TIGR02281 family clan AA aspartic protease [Alphaproteobacteria bacterium]
MIARYLPLLAFGLLGLSTVLLALRLISWPLWQGVDPVLRLTLSLAVLTFLAGAILAAALSMKTSAHANRIVWGALIIGFPALFVIDQDHENWYMQRSWQFEAALVDGSTPGVPSDIMLRRQADGHYYIDARMGDETVDFLVDTGASMIALSLNDARRLGVREDRLNFNIQVATASGMDFGAAVTLPYLDIRGHRFERVPALVMRGGEQSLLGMSIIGQFTSVEIRDDRLVLRR